MNISLEGYPRNTTLKWKRVLNLSEPNVPGTTGIHRNVLYSRQCFPFRVLCHHGTVQALLRIQFVNVPGIVFDFSPPKPYPKKVIPETEINAVSISVSVSLYYQPGYATSACSYIGMARMVTSLRSFVKGKLLADIRLPSAPPVPPCQTQSPLQSIPINLTE